MDGVNQDTMDFVEWAQRLGASRVRIADVEVEFRPLSELEIQTKLLADEEKKSQREREMMAEMDDEDRRILEKKARDELLYLSS